MNNVQFGPVTNTNVFSSDVKQDQILRPREQDQDRRSCPKVWYTRV